MKLFPLSFVQELYYLVNNLIYIIHGYIYLVYTKIIIGYYRSFDILLFLSTVKISLPLDERQNLTNKVEQAELARHVIRRKITGESLDKFFEKTKMPCFTCVVPVEKTNAQLI